MEERAAIYVSALRMQMRNHLLSWNCICFITQTFRQVIIIPKKFYIIFFVLFCVNLCQNMEISVRIERTNERTSAHSLNVKRGCACEFTFNVLAFFLFLKLVRKKLSLSWWCFAAAAKDQLASQHLKSKFVKCWVDIVFTFFTFFWNVWVDKQNLLKC